MDLKCDDSSLDGSSEDSELLETLHALANPLKVRGVPKVQEAIEDLHDFEDRFRTALQGGVDTAYAFIQLGSTHFDWQVTISKDLVEYIVGIVGEYECCSVTSIGCNHPFLEWFLAKRLVKPINVVDVSTPEDFMAQLVPSASPDCETEDFQYVQVPEHHNATVQVPRTNLLMFVWGTNAPWMKYLQEYEGPAVLFVAPQDLRRPDWILQDVQREFKDTYIFKPEIAFDNQECYLLVRRKV